MGTGAGARQASRDLRQMVAAAMVGTVSASTRRASKTSAPSSHSVKTTGPCAAAPAAAAAVAIYPANTVLLPAEGYRTGRPVVSAPMSAGRD